MRKPVRRKSHTSRFVVDAWIFFTRKSRRTSPEKTEKKKFKKKTVCEIVRNPNSDDFGVENPPSPVKKKKPREPNPIRNWAEFPYRPRGCAVA